MEYVDMVSIIMPIRNEEHYLYRTLSAILQQDYPHHLIEIVIVDGQSDDNTRLIIERICNSDIAADFNRIVVFDNPQRIVPVAFNIGLREALGNIIVRVDGHCEIARDYVRRCVEILAETGADNVGGLQRAVGETSIGKAIAIATSSPFGVGGGLFHYARRAGWVDTVYLGTYRRQVFEKIGGFDEELVRNQDDEFNFRLTQSGGKIWLDPSIHSVYYARASLRKLWRQYYQYGFYKVRVIQKRQAISSWRQIVPGTFVMSFVVSCLIALITKHKRPLLWTGGAYAFANATTSIWISRHNWRLSLFFPIIFAILHFAYGFGFLQGLWHWRKKITAR